MEVSSGGLTVGSASFLKDEITAIKAVIRLYLYPLGFGERIRNFLSKLLGRMLGPIVQILFVVLAVGTVGAISLALGDSLGFTVQQAAPFTIPIVLLAAVAAWRLSWEIAGDISLSVATGLAVSQQAARYHVLMVETEGKTHPVLATPDYRAMDEILQRVIDRLDAPASVGVYEADLEQGDEDWIPANQIVVDDDQIYFRSADETAAS